MIAMLKDSGERRSGSDAMKRIAVAICASGLVAFAAGIAASRTLPSIFVPVAVDMSRSGRTIIGVSPVHASAGLVEYPAVRIIAPHRISPGNPGLLTIEIRRTRYMLNEGVMSDAQSLDSLLGRAFEVSVSAPSIVTVSPELVNAKQRFGEGRAVLVWRFHLSPERPGSADITILGLPVPRTGVVDWRTAPGVTRDPAATSDVGPTEMSLGDIKVELYDSEGATFAKSLSENQHDPGSFAISADGVIRIRIPIYTDAGLTARQAAWVDTLSVSVPIVSGLLTLPFWVWLLNRFRRGRNAAVTSGPTGNTAPLTPPETTVDVDPKISKAGTDSASQT